MLRRAETTGVFQMESPGMRDLIKLLEPDRFEDLMALVALYRPGPLNDGPCTPSTPSASTAARQVTYPHPDLEPILAGHLRRHGLPGAGDADRGGASPASRWARPTRCARRWARRSASVLDAAAGEVRRRAPSTRRLSAKLGRGPVRPIEPFADYGFNASHACAYGYVAYQTAYLMAHHPVEYMAAILTSVKDDKDRKPYYLYACRGMDIEVLPPDVNESETDFAPAPGGRAGDPLRAVGRAQRGGGRRRADHRGAARRRARSRRSPTSAARSTRRCSRSACSSRSIHAGAFDSLGYTRGRALLESAGRRCRGPILAERKAEAAGQFSLFGGGDEGVGAGDRRVGARGRGVRQAHAAAATRRRCSGSSSPTTRCSGCATRSRRSARTRSPTSRPRRRRPRHDRRHHRRGGPQVHEARRAVRAVPARGARRRGRGRGVPERLRGRARLIETDRIVLATGRIDLRGRELQIRATEVREPDLGTAATDAAVPDALVVDLPAAACTPVVLAKLKELLEGHPGERPGAGAVPVLQGVTPLRSGRIGCTRPGRCSASSGRCSAATPRGSSTTGRGGGPCRCPRA